VYLASDHHYYAGPILEYTLVLLPEVLNHDTNDLSLVMAKLAVIDMEANFHMFAFNFLVGHTRIVLVVLEWGFHSVISILLFSD
jgi:hypothetical protein